MSMTPATLLHELTRRGVELRAEGDRLLFRPADALDPSELELLRAHKWAVLALLQDEQREASFEERAAICEYDGRLTRKDAETRALLDATLALGEWLRKRRPDMPRDLPARLAALVERELCSRNGSGLHIWGISDGGAPRRPRSWKLFSAVVGSWASVGI